MNSFLSVWVTWAVALLLLWPLPAAAQQPTVEAGQQDPIRVKAEEVLLDVVVRDRKGRPLRDLRPAEIEVYENGVKQTLTSFRWVESVPPSAPVSFETASAFDPARQLRLMTMVFDNLDVSGRRLAREAALDFLQNGLSANTFVAVYAVGHGFHLLQSFTNDREKLRQALELVAPQTTVE